MGIVENNIEQVTQWDQNSKQAKLESNLTGCFWLVAGIPFSTFPSFLLITSSFPRFSALLPNKFRW